MLARLLRSHREELRADFQQYYGLNIDGMGDEYTFLHAADLAAQLPVGSRCMGILDPNLKWGDDTRLLALIEYWLHGIVWSMTKDAKNKRNEPVLHSPVPAKKKEEKDILTLPVDEYERALQAAYERWR